MSYRNLKDSGFLCSLIISVSYWQLKGGKQRIKSAYGFFTFETYFIKGIHQWYAFHLARILPVNTRTIMWLLLSQQEKKFFFTSPNHFFAFIFIFSLEHNYLSMSYRETRSYVWFYTRLFWALKKSIPFCVP